MRKIVAKDYHKGSLFQYTQGLASLDYLELKGSERILDLGCGDGALTAEIAKRLPNGKVIGVDLSEEMVAFAKKAHPHIQFIQQDVSNLEVGDNYDGIVAQLLIHFFQDKKALLKSWRSILKPGGSLLLTAGSGESLYNQFLKKFFDKPKWRSYFNSNVWGFTKLDSYIEAASEAGFDLHFVHLKSVYLEIKSSEDFKNRLRGVLPMIGSIPKNLFESLLDDLITDAKLWALPDGKGYRIPTKLTNLVLKN